MLNHGISEDKNFAKHQTASFIKQPQATHFFNESVIKNSESGVAAVVDPVIAPELSMQAHLILPGQIVVTGWQKFKNSIMYLPSLYLILVAMLTSMGLVTYSQLTNLTAVNIQSAGQMIFIFLWAAIVAGAVMLLSRLKIWQAQRRYAPLKLVALYMWDQLDALNECVDRIQNTCQTSEKPTRATLMKCLDNYYEKSVSFHKDLQKIKLVLNDSQFNQLLINYNTDSKIFRDRLAELIVSLADQPHDQNPCKLLLDALTPLCLRIDQYHQAIAKQLGKIIRA